MKKILPLLLSILLCFPLVGFSNSSTDNFEKIDVLFYDSDGNKVEVEVLPKAPIDYLTMSKEEALEKLRKETKIERSTTAYIINENNEIVGTRTTLANVTDVSVNATTSSDYSDAYVATVLVAADEEFRAKYKHEWQDMCELLIERADDEFNSNFNIDLSVRAFALWESSGNNADKILQQLDSTFGNAYDFKIGFTLDPNFDAGGIAYVYPSKPSKSATSVVLDAGNITHYAIRHELSHNYGLHHDPEGSGIVCLMNYDYAWKVTFWHSAHKNDIASRRHWYGTRHIIN